MVGIEYIKKSFFLDLFLKDKSFPGFYSNIINGVSKDIHYLNDNIYETNLSRKIYAIFDVPDYLTLKTREKLIGVKTLKTSLYNGFYINLSQYQDLNHYLSSKLGRGRKSQLKRYRKRLDLCIAPEYKIYYGEISKNEYDRIFNNLKTLTIKRFEQKKEDNFELPYLNLYQDIMYPLILQKKANIFVIYDKEKPINITLNFIDNGLLLHWNSCYDIDYQMFNLGHVNMVNHLEWSFNQGIKIFDMGRGDFLHKRKYITNSYIYQEHIVYRSTSLSIALFAHCKYIITKAKFSFIKALKQVNVQKVYSKYAKLKYRILNTKNTNTTNQYKVIETTISKLPDSSNLEPVSLANIDERLIKSINYFLYNNKESINDVTFHQINMNLRELYIIGRKKRTKLELITYV